MNTQIGSNLDTSDRQKIQQRYQERMLQAEIDGEKLSNKARLIISGVSTVLLIVYYSICFGFLDKQFYPSDLMLMLGIIFFILYAVILAWLLRRQIYNRSIKFISLTIDNTIIAAVLGIPIFTHAAESEVLNAFTTGVGFIYFILVVVSGYRYHFWASIYSGILPATLIFILLIYSIQSGLLMGRYQWIGGADKGMLDLSDQLIKIVFLVLTGIIVAFIGRHSRRLIHDSIESQIQVERTNQNLEQLVEERTQELEEKNAILTSRNKQIKMELQLARQIQRELLPDAIPKLQRCKLVTWYMPLEETGGDFYHVQVLPDDRLNIFISDVSGHGLPAAFITSMIKISIDSISDCKQPSEMLYHLNRLLLGKTATHFVTAFNCILDLKNLTLQFANAGHVHPLLWQHDSGEIIALSSQGRLLGVQSELNLKDSAIFPLQQGDKLLLFTDGLTEAFNHANEMYGDSRLHEFLHHNFHKDIQTLLNGIVQDINLYTGDRALSDDIAILVVEITSSLSRSVIPDEKETITQ
jgi:serine phosphatase RsbU (regulator of sigma subunit)